MRKSNSVVWCGGILAKTTNGSWGSINLHKHQRIDLKCPESSSLSKKHRDFLGSLGSLVFGRFLVMTPISLYFQVFFFCFWSIPSNSLMHVILEMLNRLIAGVHMVGTHLMGGRNPMSPQYTCTLILLF